jgi:hypothetical protein
MKLGNGGEAMLGAIGQRVQPGTVVDFEGLVDAVLDRFRGLKLPDRGRYACKSMVEVAHQVPSYFVYAFEKGTDRMGIPPALYALCVDAVLHGDSLKQACRRLATRQPGHPDFNRYHGKMAPRLHLYSRKQPVKAVAEQTYGLEVRDASGQLVIKIGNFGSPDWNPLVMQPDHPNCRSVLQPISPEQHFSVVEEPEEPSFLDAEGPEDKGGSFLDGIL